MGICEGPGPCEREAVRDGFCWAHLKQLDRRGRMTALRGPPPAGIEGVLEAAIGVLEVDTGDDRAYRRAYKRFVDARNRDVAEELEKLLRGGLARAGLSTGGRRMRR